MQWSMLQRTVIVKIRMLQRTQMLQRTRKNTTGRRNTRVRMTCRAFPLWLERQSSSLSPFVLFSYQFSSVICLFAPLAVKIFLKLFCYIILAMNQQNRVRKLDGNFAVGCGAGTDWPSIHIFQCTLERTNAITNEVPEPITFVLAYPTVLAFVILRELQAINWNCPTTLSESVASGFNKIYIYIGLGADIRSQKQNKFDSHISWPCFTP
jgi:hypothetical protein